MKAVPLQLVDDYIIKMYELEDDVCRRMLNRCYFGRVGFADVQELSILPVNCLFSHGAILFRTEEGSPLDRMADGRSVAFEADHVDPVAESGWSVLVRGTASHLTDPERIAGLAETAVHPWAPGRRDRWIEIQPVQITGRIIQRYRLVKNSDGRPYMPPD